MKSTLFVLFSIVVIDLIGFGIVIPVLPFYAESYGASAAVLGGLLTSYAAMQFIFAPLWGRLSDRIGRRPVMLMTILGSSVALLLLGLANSLLWLFIARILGGIFAANISVATAYVTDVTDEKNRTKWMGMIGASFGIGFILGPAIGGLLAPYGYGVPMLTAAALALINFIYASLTLREPERHRTMEEPTKRWHFLRDSSIRKMCLLNFVFTVAVTQLEAVFAYFMMDRFQYDAREVAYILVGMALIMAGVQGGAIRSLASRFGERKLLTSGAILLMIAFVSIPWISRVAVLLLPLGIAALGRGISQPSMLSLVSKVTRPQTRGAIMGTFQSAASLGRVIGPTLAGLFYVYYIPLPFVIASLLMVTVTLISLTIAIPSSHQVSLAEAEMSMESDGTQI